MSEIKYALFGLLFMAMIASAVGQTPNEATEKISTELLIEDFKTLRSKLESSQPGLYLYTSKDSLNKIFDRMQSSITEPMTSLEFYRKIVPLNKILRNLHTRIWPTDAYSKAVDTTLPRFPLDILWLDNKMYVLRNHSSQSILPGSIIHSINGESVENIFKQFVNSRVRDGFNETYPVAQASRNFGFLYAAFVGTPNFFSIELTTSEGVHQKIELEPVTATEINTSRISKYKSKYSQYSEDWDGWIANKEPALRFEIRDQVAMMTVRTFYLPAIEAGDQNYLEFFKKSFDQIANQKINHLIIDLRNNHGGSDPVGMSLLSYLQDSVFNYYKRRTAYLKPGALSVKKGNVYEIKGRGPWTGEVKGVKNCYKGSVYVLMNGFCVSAAGEFIGHLKNLNRAVFIGEEAGGNPVSFAGGESIPIDLPHSHITGTIPLQLVEMNVLLKNDGHGIKPDYEVKPSIIDILNEKDIEMEFAIKLIKSEND